MTNFQKNCIKWNLFLFKANIFIDMMPKYNFSYFTFKNNTFSNTYTLDLLKQLKHTLIQDRILGLLALIEKQRIWGINPWHKKSVHAQRKTHKKQRNSTFIAVFLSKSQWGLQLGAKETHLTKFKTALSTNLSAILCKMYQHQIGPWK